MVRHKKTKTFQRQDNLTLLGLRLVQQGLKTMSYKSVNRGENQDIDKHSKMQKEYFQLTKYQNNSNPISMGGHI